MSATTPLARPRAQVKRARVACLACQQKKQKVSNIYLGSRL